MILGTKDNGQKILLRCGCSHEYVHDKNKYGYEYEDNDGRVIIFFGDDNTCTKCWYWGWRITGMTDEELRRREV